MMENFLPFAAPDIGEEEIFNVINALNSGWVTTGPIVKNFENAFVNFLNSNSPLEAVAVNSATAGLHLALEAAGIVAGDEVITTAHTFTATAEVIRYLGAHPIFIDIDSSYCLNISTIEAALTSRTKAIIPVHFGGLSVNMDILLRIASRYGLKVIEDAAHALPTTYHGKLIGSMTSTATVFSFYANKTITTGEGGMLVTSDPEIAKRARIMRLHGINRDAFDRFTSKVPSWYYEVVAPGYKYNMTDIAASIGMAQLKKVYKFQERRQKIALSYNKAFADLPVILPPMPPQGDMHSWHLYVLRLREDAPIRRDLFVEKMFEFGIGCSVHYIPLHLQPYWRDTYDLNPEMFPVSQKLYGESVSLPIYSKMSDLDIQRVIDVVKYLLS